MIAAAIKADGEARTPHPRLVQAICDFVHDRITFGYEHANPMKTACGAFVSTYGELKRRTEQTPDSNRFRVSRC
jgi:hypothetical protein